MCFNELNNIINDLNELYKMKNEASPHDKETYEFIKEELEN